MYIVEKILVFLLVYSILIVLKEAAKFFLVMRSALNGDPGEHKYMLSTGNAIKLACAISYIVTIIFTGFKLF